jgi:hypothetical protein
MVDRSDPIAASAYSRISLSRMKRGFEAPRVQNQSACPHHSLGLRRAGIRSPLPKTGRGSARPSSKASGPPAVDALGTTADDVLGLPSAKEAGLRSPTSATAAALSLWLRLGRLRTTSSSGTSAIPALAATGGSTGKSATASAGAGAGASNTSGGLGAVATSAAPPARWPPQWRGQPGRLAPWQLVPPGPPLEGVLCGGQPTGVPRCGTGRRSRHCLKGLLGGQTSRALPPFAERKR